MTWLWLTLAAVVLLAVGDVVLWARGGVKATISRHVVALAYAYPLLPLLVGLGFGILGGHLFWAQPLPGLCP